MPGCCGTGENTSSGRDHPVRGEVSTAAGVLGGQRRRAGIRRPYTGGVTTTVRRAGTTDASALADLAAATFPLACPPDSDPDDIADFIATQLSRERFVEYLADDRRVIVDR